MKNFWFKFKFYWISNHLNDCVFCAAFKLQLSLRTNKLFYYFTLEAHGQRIIKYFSLIIDSKYLYLVTITSFKTQD